MTIEQAIAIGGVNVLEYLLIKKFCFDPLKARLATENAIEYILKNGVKLEIETNKLNKKG